MDEIEYKLKSKNVILVTEAIERLIDVIIKASSETIELEDSSYPLTFLKEKCTSEDPVVSLTASKGFLNLIAAGILEISPAMSVAMSMLPSAKNYSGITSIISGILSLIVEQEMGTKSVYTSRWSLVSPQHPLVMVLQQHPASIDNILSQVESICLYNTRLSTHGIELMRPVFMWILCDPNELQTNQIYHRAIQILLGLENSLGQASLILECLEWQQTSYWSKRTFCMYTSVLDWAISNRNDAFVFAVMLALGNMAIEIILCGEDPRPSFTIIQKALNYPGTEIISEVLLAILSEAVLVCPVSYLTELMILCQNLCQLCGSSISECIFSSAVLQWLYYPNTLADGSTDIAKEVLDSILKRPPKSLSNHTLKLNANNVFNAIKSTHSRIYNAAEIIINHIKLVSDKEKFDAWVKQLNESANMEMKLQIVFYLDALLRQKFNSKSISLDKLGIIKALQNVVEYKKELATGMLPIVLNSFKQSKNPAEIVEFLREIINLAVTKENVPLVIQLLETFRNENIFPKSVLIDLYASLVGNQTRCYPYLQELLVDSKPSNNDAEWELLTAKSAAVKLICEDRAANYGAEMVPVISSLLSRCTDSSTAAAYCMALEALKGLWHARVVAPVSTWKALAPRIGKDKRPIVQASVCKLLSEVPKLNNETPEYDAFMSDVTAKLWSYVVDSHYPEVSIAALRALSKFKVESMTLKEIPEIYRRSVQLPATYCKTPSDAARRPEDVLLYIPSECWGNLFKYANQSALEGVSDLCHALMEREVSEYRSKIYSATDGLGPRGEPQTAAYLPVASVARGLLEFIRKESISPTYDCPATSFLDCLHCLGRPLSRPLPPMQWNFLSDLAARGQHFCIAALPLAARQAAISGTALRFLQNYLPALRVTEEKEEEITKVIEILPILCKNVQSTFIKTILWKIMEYYFELPQNVDGGENKCQTDIKSVLKSIKDSLTSESITDDNRSMLSELVEFYYDKMDCDHRHWPAFVKVCGELSSEYLERMTSPSSWWEVSGGNLRKACCVRVHMALTSQQECPLVWLNEIIDASINMPREHVYVLKSICPALMTAKCDNFSCKDWLLQLMARTQVHMADQSSTENSISFLCDVVVLSVIMFTNYYIFTWRDTDALVISRALRLNMFPQAISFLFVKSKYNEWTQATGLVLEWLHHSRSNSLLPRQYAETFHTALVAGRASPYFKKQNVWTKFLSVKPLLQDI